MCMAVHYCLLFFVQRSQSVDGETGLIGTVSKRLKRQQSQQTQLAELPKLAEFHPVTAKLFKEMATFFYYFMDRLQMKVFYDRSARHIRMPADRFMKKPPKAHIQKCIEVITQCVHSKLCNTVDAPRIAIRYLPNFMDKAAVNFDEKLKYIYRTYELIPVPDTVKKYKVGLYEDMVLHGEFITVHGKKYWEPRETAFSWTACISLLLVDFVVLDPKGDKDTSIESLFSLMSDVSECDVEWRKPSCLQPRTIHSVVRKVPDDIVEVGSSTNSTASGQPSETKLLDDQNASICNSSYSVSSASSYFGIIAV